MPEIIHIIEPTLTNQTGHCYSFIASFCRASKGYPLCLWTNRSANITLTEKNVQVMRHFSRKIRRLQSYMLYRKLLGKAGKIFLSTATFADLIMMKWASTEEIKQRKVYFYFHWIKATVKKRAFLAKLALKQPNLIILGPTPSVIEVFHEAGFINTHVVPYPISGLITNTHAGYDRFSSLLYAGAARQDKGISHVVDLVEYMARSKADIPMKLQNSPDHRGKYDEATNADIDRLKKINYPLLQLFPETLSSEEYANQFVGAICIQLYNVNDFADRISGVTLDALSAGSPIIATAGTWTARMVERFDAGLVIGRTEPEIVWSGVQKIIADYPRYNKNAYFAGLELQQENSAEILFKTVAA